MLPFVRCLLLVLALLGAAGLAVAEPTTAPPDSSRVRQAHRRVVFQFDQRYSLLQGQTVGINGLKLGVEWRGRLRTGLGLYFLSTGVPTNAPVPEFIPPGTEDKVRFRYAALYGEYVVVGTPRWEVSLPVQAGLGRYYIRYQYPDGTFYRTPKRNIWLIEPTIGGHMRVFRWVGLGAGVGYRQALLTADKLEDDISGVVFYGRVKLFLGDFIKVVRGHERLFSQRGLRRRDHQPRP
ncbi:hypothetical protein F0P96_17620 [Hymenobacter busanensis]|uniref:Uncharacterized protein n=1 Tax=Hymenobacter busanensis TaxID=2607656 RepID=A0A7L5A201_9BACT|nr:hypothetical protein [Hymenobacter busanensis]KAA9327060.1 hypothetical protein F0P96_17620 [Hymenobacter busanensis]QHJ09511.1 hypothetical protein GUY19_20435 [Hymenobacter busanensis]